MERNISTATVVPSAQVDAYLAVDADGAVTTATGDNIYGIVRTGNQAANESIDVVTSGECYATAGEAIAKGELFTGGADGKIMKARNDLTIDFVTPTYTYTFDRARGEVLEAASADGDVIRVLLY